MINTLRILAGLFGANYFWTVSFELAIAWFTVALTGMLRFMYGIGGGDFDHAGGGATSPDSMLQVLAGNVVANTIFVVTILWTLYAKFH